MKYYVFQLKNWFLHLYGKGRLTIIIIPHQEMSETAYKSAQ
jgi:hypothetical protein